MTIAVTVAHSLLCLIAGLLYESLGHGKTAIAFYVMTIIFGAFAAYAGWPGQPG